MSIVEFVVLLSFVDHVLSYPILILSGLIICLSLKVVPSSLSRTYCLNVAVPSFLSTFLFTLATVLDIFGLRPQTDDHPLVLIYAFLRGFTLYGYLYFSTLTIFLAYIGYAKPLLFQALVKTRNIVMMFGFGYVWTSIAVLALFPRYIVTKLFKPLEEVDFSVPMMVEIVVAVILYLLMLLLYILAIIRMVRRLHSESSSSISHWNVLKSVLIYCTPPNIFVALALSGYMCDAVLESRGFFRPSSWPSKEAMRTAFQNEQLCGPIRVWSQSLTNVRLFVSVATALIAFRDYRVAIRNGSLRIGIRVLKTLRIVDQNYEVYVTVILLTAFFRGFTVCSYLYFSIVTILLAYMGYAKPLFFQRLMKTKNMVMIFGFGYLWTTVSMISIFPRWFLLQVLPISEDYDFSALMIGQVVLSIAFYISMLVFYVLAIMRIVKRADQETSSSKTHRNVLKSVLIYCTPPNILIALVLSGYVCDTVEEVIGVFRPSHWSSEEERANFIMNEDFCIPVRSWSQGLSNVRLLINVFTALFAFHDYRVVVMKGLCRALVPVLKAFKISNGTNEDCSNENSLFRKSPKNTISSQAGS
ncbi:hypothetical protein QR680_006214 [Steinernema hermaphroditum]|uniref:Uncharacterized protein n=1 Tax=Steinernema hermaphroditum TaxID=289476 RepID=A0AA39LWR2_9BILA|nr:hypothetical protein QR680_006214 [Steinernema hermaphroditum]